MDDDIFSIVRQKIKAAGTDDPYEVAKFHGIEFIWLKGTIAGYATHYMKLVPIIGINEKLDRVWYRFGGWHELTHVFDDHIYEEGFSNEHCDGAFFAQEIDSRSLSHHERIANLVSADVNVDDDLVVEITGYNTRTMRQYRRLKAYLESLKEVYDQLQFSAYSDGATSLLKTKMHDTRRKIQVTSDAILDLESDLANIHQWRTFSQMAAEVGTNERIFRYKLEAMRLRGFDIDRQELES